MNITRRKFISTAATAAVAVVLPPVLAKPKSVQKQINESWDWAKKHDTVVSLQRFQRPPIQVYCLGTDDNPVTSLDIQNVMHWIKENAKKDKIMLGRERDTGVTTYGRIPVYYEFKPWSGVQNIHCRHCVIECPGHGFLQVRIGSDNRPAQKEDLEDIGRHLADVLTDPELSIVTHHNFEMSWHETQYPDTYDAFVVPHDYPDVPTDRDIAGVWPGKYIYHERNRIVTVTKTSPDATRPTRAEFNFLVVTDGGHIA
jgi:hypothetical protein